MNSVLINKNDGGIIYNSAYEYFLKRNHFFDFDHIIYIKGDEVVKSNIKERIILSLTVENKGGFFKIYLKKYFHSFFSSFFLKNAVDEFKTICDFHSENIPTITPVCSGEKKRWFFEEKSFLITESLNDAERLDKILADNTFSKRQLLDIFLKLANLIKKLHGCGFIHKDLYLCHIMMDKKGNLFIVDLHRVKRFKNPSLRYLVKDIAALNYSADEIKIRNYYKVTFIKNYFSREKLNSEMKSFINKVNRKTEKMKKHNRKFLK